MTSRSFDSVCDLCHNHERLSKSELASRLEAILKTNPDVAHEEDRYGHTLLHHAVLNRRLPDFCKLLVDVNPVVVKDDNNGRRPLPLHVACSKCNVETMKYLYHIYPECINIPKAWDGNYPLHIFVSKHTRYEEEAVEIAKFLLKYDQGALSKSNNSGSLPLHIACRVWGLAIVKLIFNAYPEAIHIRNNRNWIPLNYARCHWDKNTRRDLLPFLDRQIDLERQAHEDRTPDNHGRVPIHRALQNRDTSVGAIKLMMAANPARTDNQGLTLLHHVCRGGNLETFTYIMGLEKDSLKVPDMGENFPLHHACMRGNCDFIPLILEQSTFGVTLQNSAKQIPLELLLFESECDRDSIEYVEAVTCLLQVNPVDTLECLMGKDKSTTDDCVEQYRRVYRNMTL